MRYNGESRGESAGKKNNYLSDYNSKGKKPSQYKPSIDSYSYSEQQASRVDKSGIPKGDSNRAGMKNLKLYNEQVN